MPVEDRPTPITGQVPITSVDSFRQILAGQSGGASGPDGAVTDIFAQLGLGDLSQFEPEAQAQAAAASNDPLVWAAMTTAQQMSLLPKWMKDLKILGLNQVGSNGPEGLFVYMHDTTTTRPGSDNPSQFDTPQGFREGNDTTAGEEIETSKAQTVERALNLPYLWDEDEVDEALKRMQDAGLQVESFEDVTQVWGALVDRAAKTFTLSEGERKVTPWDVLDLIKREDQTALGDKDGDPENFTHTSTSRSVQDISEGEAWSVLQSNLSRMLGRDPSDQEVRDFTHRMNSLAARNPAISKTISTYKDGRLTNSTTTEVDSGFTPDDMVKDSYDAAQADPEYGAYQAASTYFNATMQAIGAIGDV